MKTLAQACARASAHQPDRGRTKTTSLILLARRRRTLRERPGSVGKSEHQQPVILARRPQRASGGIEVNLCRAPGGTAPDEIACKSIVVIGARANGGRPGRVEGSNLTSD